MSRVAKLVNRVLIDYWLLKIIFGTSCWFYLRIKHRQKLEIKGKHHIPKKGPCLFYANHPSMMDPILILTIGFYPRVIWQPQFLPWSLAAAENFLTDDSRRLPFVQCIPWLRDLPLLKILFDNVCIPVKAGRRDHQALKKAIDKINKDGLNVMIFPEGGRTKSVSGLDPFQGGIGALYYLADQIQAVIPIAISSDARKILPKGQDWPNWQKGKIKIIFGTDINPLLCKYRKGVYRFVPKKIIYHEITKKLFEELEKLKKIID